ncbi:NADH(P)-binding-domain-containing protein [Phanerochaete sordida]|uniref:NADH(P)-binding-domain-containing protein n=1 Tax=Phanerochaete sordida TaxID=48140 RepID=A0A9P3LH72_9APHY|nr:NADH(P)-binding-domain-containing protein [Phanerochaete sordida]
MRLTRLLVARGDTVVSVFRNGWQAQAVSRAGATPIVLNLEEDGVETFAAVFAGKDVVYFCAGAEGHGGPTRYRTVDYAGARKVFDALELIRGPKPRLIMLSAIDVRDRDKIPAHYTPKDLQHSDHLWTAMGAFLQAKYDADRDLARRRSFKWTILRPGWLTDAESTGRAAVGKAPLGATISRDDVARALALLADRPEADGLGIDINGGEEKIEDGLARVIRRRASDFDP